MMHTVFKVTRNLTTIEIALIIFSNPSIRSNALNSLPNFELNECSWTQLEGQIIHVSRLPGVCYVKKYQKAPLIINDILN